MKLAIVIVSYNVRAYLLQCLDSVCRATANMDAEVWVVDNASTDDSVTATRAAFPDVHVVANTENVGFARANNLVMRQTKADFVLLLNPDTIVAENTLQACLDFFNRHAEAGALGIHMLNSDGSFARESRRGLPTPMTSIYKVCGLCRLMPTHPRFGRYYMGHLPEWQEGCIDVISGAFMMLRRQTLQDVGLLDEDYFMYGEDVDLSYRVGKSGWQCWYSPQLMLHYKGESTKKTSFRYVHSFYNAMLIFFRKHFARRYWGAWLAVEVGVILLGLAAMVRGLAKRFGFWINGLWQRLKGSNVTAETLCFVGSDEAWQHLATLCQRAGIAATRVDDITHADRHAMYLAFDAPGHSYADILQSLMEAHRCGSTSVLAIFHTDTNTLITPNDIFC